MKKKLSVGNIICKVISILLIIADIAMLWLAPFITVTKDIIEGLDFGNGLMGLVVDQAVTSYLEQAIDRLSKGIVTLPDYQKFFQALVSGLNIFSGGMDRYVVLTKVFFGVIIAFTVVGCISIVLELLNINLCPILILMDIVLAALTGYFLLSGRSLFEELFGAPALAIGPFGIAILVIPVVASIFWTLGTLGTKRR